MMSDANKRQLRTRRKKTMNSLYYNSDYSNDISIEDSKSRLSGGKKSEGSSSKSKDATSSYNTKKYSLNNKNHKHSKSIMYHKNIIYSDEYMDNINEDNEEINENHLYDENNDNNMNDDMNENNIIDEDENENTNLVNIDDENVNDDNNNENNDNIEDMTNDMNNNVSHNNIINNDNSYNNQIDNTFLNINNKRKDEEHINNDDEYIHKSRDKKKSGSLVHIKNENTNKFEHNNKNKKDSVSANGSNKNNSNTSSSNNRSRHVPNNNEINYAKMAEKLPHVVGVRFDKSQNRWLSGICINGRCINRYFPVYKFGFEEARRLAIQHRKNFETANVGHLKKQQGEAKTSHLNLLNLNSQLPNDFKDIQGKNKLIFKYLSYDSIQKEWVVTYDYDNKVLVNKFPVDIYGYNNAYEMAVHCINKLNICNQEKLCKNINKQENSRGLQGDLLNNFNDNNNNMNDNNNNILDNNNLIDNNNNNSHDNNNLNLCNNSSEHNNMCEDLSSFKIRKNKISKLINSAQANFLMNNQKSELPLNDILNNENIMNNLVHEKQKPNINNNNINKKLEELENMRKEDTMFLNDSSSYLSANDLKLLNGIKRLKTDNSPFNKQDDEFLLNYKNLNKYSSTMQNNNTYDILNDSNYNILQNEGMFSLNDKKGINNKDVSKNKNITNNNYFKPFHDEAENNIYQLLNGKYLTNEDKSVHINLLNSVMKQSTMNKLSNEDDPFEKREKKRKSKNNMLEQKGDDQIMNMNKSIDNNLVNNNNINAFNNNNNNNISNNNINNNNDINNNGIPFGDENFDALSFDDYRKRISSKKNNYSNIGDNEKYKKLANGLLDNGEVLSKNLNELKMYHLAGKKEKDNNMNSMNNILYNNKNNMKYYTHNEHHKNEEIKRNQLNENINHENMLNLNQMIRNILNNNSVDNNEKIIKGINILKNMTMNEKFNLINFNNHCMNYSYNNMMKKENYVKNIYKIINKGSEDSINYDEYLTVKLDVDDNEEKDQNGETNKKHNVSEAYNEGKINKKQKKKKKMKQNKLDENITVNNEMIGERDNDQIEDTNKNDDMSNNSEDTNRDIISGEKNSNDSDEKEEEDKEEEKEKEKEKEKERDDYNENIYNNMNTDNNTPNSNDDNEQLINNEINKEINTSINEFNDIAFQLCPWKKGIQWNLLKKMWTCKLWDNKGNEITKNIHIKKKEGIDIGYKYCIKIRTNSFIFYLSKELNKFPHIPEISYDLQNLHFVVSYKDNEKKIYSFEDGIYKSFIDCMEYLNKQKREYNENIYDISNFIKEKNNLELDDIYKELNYFEYNRNVLSNICEETKIAYSIKPWLRGIIWEDKLKKWIVFFKDKNENMRISFFSISDYNDDVIMSYNKACEYFSQVKESNNFDSNSEEFAQSIKNVIKNIQFDKIIEQQNEATMNDHKKGNLQEQNDIQTNYYNNVKQGNVGETNNDNEAENGMDSQNALNANENNVNNVHILRSPDVLYNSGEKQTNHFLKENNISNEHKNMETFYNENSYYNDDITFLNYADSNDTLISKGMPQYLSLSSKKRKKKRTTEDIYKSKLDVLSYQNNELYSNVKKENYDENILENNIKYGKRKIELDYLSYNENNINNNTYNNNDYTNDDNHSSKVYSSDCEKGTNNNRKNEDTYDQENNEYFYNKDKLLFDNENGRIPRDIKKEPNDINNEYNLDHLNVDDIKNINNNHHNNNNNNNNNSIINGPSSDGETIILSQYNKNDDEEDDGNNTDNSKILKSFEKCSNQNSVSINKSNEKLENILEGGINMRLPKSEILNQASRLPKLQGMFFDKRRNYWTVSVCGFRKSFGVRTRGVYQAYKLAAEFRNRILENNKGKYYPQRSTSMSSNYKYNTKNGSIIIKDEKLNYSNISEMTSLDDDYDQKKKKGSFSSNNNINNIDKELYSLNDKESNSSGLYYSFNVKGKTSSNIYDYFLDKKEHDYFASNNINNNSNNDTNNNNNIKNDSKGLPNNSCYDDHYNNIENQEEEEEGEDVERWNNKNNDNKMKNGNNTFGQLKYDSALESNLINFINEVGSSDFLKDTKINNNNNNNNNNHIGVNKMSQHINNNISNSNTLNNSLNIQNISSSNSAISNNGVINNYSPTHIYEVDNLNNSQDYYLKNEEIKNELNNIEDNKNKKDISNTNSLLKRFMNDDIVINNKVKQQSFFDSHSNYNKLGNKHMKTSAYTESSLGLGFRKNGYINDCELVSNNNNNNDNDNNNNNNNNVNIKDNDAILNKLISSNHDSKDNNNNNVKDKNREDSNKITYNNNNNNNDRSIGSYVNNLGVIEGRSENNKGKDENTKIFNNNKTLNNYEPENKSYNYTPVIDETLEERDVRINREVSKCKFVDGLIYDEANKCFRIKINGYRKAYSVIRRGVKEAYKLSIESIEQIKRQTQMNTFNNNEQQQVNTNNMTQLYNSSPENSRHISCYNYQHNNKSKIENSNDNPEEKYDNINNISNIGHENKQRAEESLFPMLNVDDKYYQLLKTSIIICLNDILMNCIPQVFHLYKNINMSNDIKLEDILCTERKRKEQSLKYHIEYTQNAVGVSSLIPYLKLFSTEILNNVLPSAQSLEIQKLIIHSLDIQTYNTLY
ncbi:transcription factor with AP2 domain(s) [Plasmodium gaboni]|uniref:Transcription factor with AP2 domain(S) n=1 Tax=Plasmodium gaboni TaxID=647221 RepID=A0ABY1UQJ3_9APIC|nr:transcription factor with AP2 domain(s) [Plasmodium gaboni]